MTGSYRTNRDPNSALGPLTVVREKDLIKIPTDLMPLEYAAMHRELCVAYRLLEDHGDLKPGDAGESNCPVSFVSAATKNKFAFDPSQ